MCPAPNLPDQKEQVQPSHRFDHGVSFGHSFEDLDMDQITTWYLAMKFGHIPDTIAAQHITCTDGAQLPDLTDPQRLVIEGVPPDHIQTIAGNVENGPKGEGAVQMYYDAFQREVFAQLKIPDDAKERLKEFGKWFKYSEHDRRDTDNGPKRPELKKLAPRDLEAATRIFFALKLKFKDDEQALFAASKTLFNSLLNDFRTTPLAEGYAQELADLDQQEAHDITRLEQAAEEGKLNVIQTLTGLSIANFDIRGMNIRKGAMEVARNKTHADIIMLVDEKQGKPVTKFSVSGAKAASHPELTDAAAIMADRLPASEALFGKGFAFSRLHTVGGHQNFTGMAREGTGVPPQDIVQAVQRFFDTRRFTADQFAEVASHFAQAAGIEQVSSDTVVLPRDPFELAGREMTLVLPGDEGRPVPVKIPEEDVALYATCFIGKTSSEVQAVLRQKTASTEPEEIRKLREERAKTALAELLPRKKGTELLKITDDLNLATLRKLGKQTLVDMFDAITADPVARQQVWDKHNQVYRIRDPVFHHVDKTSEAYRGARYRYKSVPQKVDGILAAEVTEIAAFSRNADSQRTVGEMFLRALTSEEYKASHQETAYDALLASTLRYIGDARIDRGVRQQLAQHLVQEYGADMRADWQRTVVMDAGSINSAIHPETGFPDIFKPLTEQLDFALADVLQGVPKSTVIGLDQDRLLEHMVTQEAVIGTMKEQYGIYTPPTTNIALEILRPTTTRMKEGIYRSEWSGGKRVHEPAVDFDALIKVDGFLTLEGSTTGADRAHDSKIAAKTIELVKEALRIAPDNRVRIVLGGTPDMLTARIVAQLGSFTPEQQSKIFLSFMNQQEDALVELSYEELTI